MFDMMKNTSVLKALLLNLSQTTAFIRKELFCVLSEEIHCITSTFVHKFLG